jgi:hypothetical protein
MRPAAAHSLSVCDGQFARLQAEMCFSDAQVIGKTDFTFFAACAPRTLRGFFDKLTPWE